MILKTLLLLICSISTLAAQSTVVLQALVGEWELIGVSTQNKELPELEGLINVYLYKNQDYVLKTALEGNTELHKGIWYADSLDTYLLHLETVEHHFQWKIHAIDQQTLVIKDLKDETDITFRKKNLLETKADAQKIEGHWFLAEAAGKTFTPSDEESAHIFLTAEQQIEAKGLPNLKKGYWALSADAKFFMVTDSIHTQVFEILYQNAHDFILRDGTDVFFFRRTPPVVNENVKGMGRRLIGTWVAENPPLPILKAELLFQKDGTMNGVSNLNSELRRWELSEEGRTLKLLPYMEVSEDEAFELRLYMIDKSTIILSDAEMTVVFKKQ